jgi:hypothetical protein
MIRHEPPIEGNILHKIAPGAFQKFTVMGE